MRHVAALPSLSLLAGSACGLLLLGPPFLVASLALTVALVAAVWATVRGRARVLALAVACGFFAGGALLSAVEWQRAWRPPLRLAFEDLARVERADAANEGRRLPEDDAAFAIVEGTLRADAAASDGGASLSVAVEGIVRRRLDEPQGQDRRGLEQRDRDEPREDAATDKFRRAVAGGILVTVVGSLAAERLGEWRASRRVRMPVQLRRPSRYLDPGVPDHERELARRGTTLVGTVKSGALVEVIGRGGWWSERLADGRAFARRAITNGVGPWSPRSSAIVAAIVIGDRSQLDADVQRALQEAGTYHVIAISGGNIAILAGLLVGAFRFAGWLGRGAMIAAMATIVVYAQLVGGGASVDRATFTAVVYFGARALDQRSPPLNTLAVVAALLVVSNPLSVVDPAFLLTFGATLAIVVVVPAFDAIRVPKAATLAIVAVPAFDAVLRTQGTPLSNASAAQWSWPRRVYVLPLVQRSVALLWAMLLASAAAEVLLMPVGAHIFSRVTLAGLCLNFLAIPMMAVAQVAGMAVVAAALVSAPLALGIGWVAHAGAHGLVWSADLVRFAPALAWRVAPPALALCAVYYVALVMWWTLWRRRVLLAGSAEARLARRARWTSAVVAAVTALGIALDPRTLIAARGDGRLHVTVLDVGQGDSIFVVFPRGSTLLVDAGGLGFASGFDIGDRVVAPVIRAAGFRRLDRLALTHGDPDHVGGALSIVRDFRPREIWEGIPVPRSETLAQLRTAAESVGTRWSNVYAGDHAAIDGVEVIARHPPPADWERQKVRNDDSLVLELRWRDVSILLTGDIGRVPERTLSATIPPARLRVLKIPHHGSLTSSTPALVNALRPTIAIVSAGRANHFGHPVPEVLARYERVGARVFRTDRDGAVLIDSDGYSLDVRTWTAFHEATKDTKSTKP